MRAVPKVSANYLEALERWDTGAVQILLSMSITYGRFWLSLLGMLLLCAAILAPLWMEYAWMDLFYVWTGQPGRVTPVVANVLGDRWIIDTILVGFSATVFSMIFGELLSTPSPMPRPCLPRSSERAPCRVRGCRRRLRSGLV